MNYYPNNNLYQNYSYGNPIQQQNYPTLQGKVVDNAEMVKVSEVPFGGFGIFPKGDLSEIYVKSWNNNGTTQINTYRPVPAEEIKEIDLHKELLEKIDMLSKKIDALSGSSRSEISKTQSAVQEPVAAKDVRVNAY